MIIALLLLLIIFISTIWSFYKLKQEIKKVHDVSYMNLSQIKTQVFNEIVKLSKNVNSLRRIILLHYENKNDTNTKQ